MHVETTRARRALFNPLFALLASVALFQITACATRPAATAPPAAATPPSPAAAPAAPAPPAAVSSRPEYPTAQASDFSEALHGNTVADPYRWLEKVEDPQTTAFVAAQNALTRSVLDRAERAVIQRRLTELYDYPRVGLPKKAGKRYFFTKNSGLQNQSVYYVQEGLTGEPRVVLDPNTLSADGTVAVSNFSPTEDGSLVGYAISKSGSDRQEIFVRDLATGQDLPDKLPLGEVLGHRLDAGQERLLLHALPRDGNRACGRRALLPEDLLPPAG